VELDQAIRRRRMCRRFQDRTVPPEVVDRLIDRARRAPSAGDTQGWAFVVLEGPEQTQRFWSTDSDPAWLAEPDHPGLLLAPVLVIPFCSHQAYLARYSQPDKTATGLAVEDRWPAPYWLIDTVCHHAAPSRGGRGGTGGIVFSDPRRSGPAAHRVRSAR
jgi:nitroreductase